MVFQKIRDKLKKVSDRSENAPDKFGRVPVERVSPDSTPIRRVPPGSVPGRDPVRRIPPGGSYDVELVYSWEDSLEVNHRVAGKLLANSPE